MGQVERICTHYNYTALSVNEKNVPTSVICEEFGYYILKTNMIDGKFTEFYEISKYSKSKKLNIIKPKVAIAALNNHFKH